MHLSHRTAHPRCPRHPPADRARRRRIPGDYACHHRPATRPRRPPRRRPPSRRRHHAGGTSACTRRPSPSPTPRSSQTLTSTARNAPWRSYAWDDPAITAAAAREFDGAKFLQAILDGSLPGAPIAHTLDFRPVSVRPGVVAFEFTPAEYHYNPIGSVHGGMLATLCDSACGCAVQSLLPAGTYYTSLDLSVKFLRPVTAATGPMTCEGTVTHLGGRSALSAGYEPDDRRWRQALRARHQQLHDLPPGGGHPDPRLTRCSQRPDPLPSRT